MHVFLATMGERPEAVTVALELLAERFHYDVVAILHTSRHASRIGDALTRLEDYLLAQALPLRSHELTLPDGAPLIDITDSTSAQGYYHAVLNVLKSYRDAGYRQHLMVSGGRKAMSIYAMQAAALVFDYPHDKVWTVLSPPHILHKGQWSIPPGDRAHVQVVDMPLVTARLAPGVDPMAYAEQRVGNRAAFMSKLSGKERELVEMLRSHPDATNDDLAALLNKSAKTIENQFGKIYDKLIGFLEMGETVRHKREALLNLLRDE